MYQCALQKQSLYDIHTWSTRLLTVDASKGVVFLSKKNHPEFLTHRKLLLSEVRLWPRYSVREVRASHTSRAARLTLCLYGYEMKGTKEDALRVSEVHTQSDLSHLPAWNFEGMDPLHSEASLADIVVQDAVPEGKRDKCVLRVTSFDVLEALLTFLSVAVAHTPGGCIKGSLEDVVTSDIAH